MPSRSEYMPGEADAAALLEAQQHIALEHFLANVFETGSLVSGEGIARGAGTSHRPWKRGGERFHRPALPLLRFSDDVPKQEANRFDAWSEVGRRRIMPPMRSASPSVTKQKSARLRLSSRWLLARNCARWVRG